MVSLLQYTGIALTSPIWLSGLLAEVIYHAVTGVPKPHKEDKFKRIRYHLGWALWPFTLPEILYLSPRKQKRIKELEVKLEQLNDQVHFFNDDDWVQLLEDEIKEVSRVLDQEKRVYRTMYKMT